MKLNVLLRVSWSVHSRGVVRHRVRHWMRITAAAGSLVVGFA